MSLVRILTRWSICFGLTFGHVFSKVMRGSFQLRVFRGVEPCTRIGFRKGPKSNDVTVDNPTGILVEAVSFNCSTSASVKTHRQTHNTDLRLYASTVFGFYVHFQRRRRRSLGRWLCSTRRRPAKLLKSLKTSLIFKYKPWACRITCTAPTVQPEHAPQASGRTKWRG